MTWATPDNTAVSMIADTDTGDNQFITTPYNDTSIIWDAVQTFPVDQIAPYQEPSDPPN